MVLVITVYRINGGGCCGRRGSGSSQVSHWPHGGMNGRGSESNGSEDSAKKYNSSVMVISKSVRQIINTGHTLSATQNHPLPSRVR